MAGHGRYVYKPLDYGTYMKNYIGTLRSGELLVDFDQYDLYVTEEGINLPIPTTKGLREAVMHFLDNELGTVTLRKSQISDEILNTARMKNKIDQQHQELYSRGILLQNEVNEEQERYAYIHDLNAKNVNQLGDINLQLSNIGSSLNADTKELQAYIDKFNQVNNDHSFQDGITKSNKTLMGLWDDIVNLMDKTNMKLDSLGHVHRSAKYPVVTVTQGMVYDINYDNCLDWYQTSLWGWDTWNTRFKNNKGAWAAACSNGAILSHFTRWFNMQSGDIINGLYRNGYSGGWWYGGYPGTGMLYKGFPFKKDLRLEDKYDYPYNTGMKLSYPGTNYRNSSVKNPRPSNFDMMQIPPVTDLNPNYTKNNRYDYVSHPANWSTQPISAYHGSWADQNTSSYWGGDRYNFRTKIRGMGGGSNASYAGTFSVGGNQRNKIYNLNLDAISTVDKNNSNKRNLKETWSQGNQGIPSAYRAMPVMAYPWVSLPGLGNNKNAMRYCFRMGCEKEINTTTVVYKTEEEDIV